MSEIGRPTPTSETGTYHLACGLTSASLDPARDVFVESSQMTDNKTVRTDPPIKPPRHPGTYPRPDRKPVPDKSKK
jgi:hypothetical protein